MYAGLAVYKAGTDADEGTWKEGDILKKELEIIRDAFDHFDALGMFGLSG